MSHKNSFQIKAINVSDHRIDYDYEIKGDWTKYFNLNEKLFIEYSIDIANVPESIAIIPLIANILPIVWLCDAEIIVPTLDQSFYESIPNFKKGYQEMYPMLEFKGNIQVSELKANECNNTKGALALFSGGVDAYNTLVNHVNESPTLVTLWGSDVKLDDSIGWQIVNNHIDSVCAEFDLNSVKVKTNFRKFINESELDALVRESRDGWWHGFHHGLGIISHTAPIAAILAKSIVYIASSFTKEAKGVTCASDPTIDNHIRFGNTSVVHDGYEFSRQMKIGNITRYANTTGHNIKLHVCWQSSGGENCCKCEKCLRTIIGVYASGDKPIKYGFKYSKFSRICQYFNTHRFMIHNNYIRLRWEPIQKELQKNYSYKEVEPSLRWFYKADLGNFNPNPLSVRIKRRLRRILKLS